MTTRVVQVCRHIAEGGGVSGVAWHLERELTALGYDCSRITAGGRLARISKRLSKFPPLALAIDVFCFSLVAPLQLRFTGRRKPTLSISHNDCVTGDVYVNHGLHKAMLRDSGYARALRNPLHAFLLFRESIRHNVGLYRVVVCLSSSEADRLTSTYRIRRPIRVIPNGVDTERFTPTGDRVDLRSSLGMDERSVHLVFVGYEFERKGLRTALHALQEAADGVELWVVGGRGDDLPKWLSIAATLGIADRVHFVGPQRRPERYLQAADVFLFPSRFEASPLVVLEAMACGLPCLLSPGSSTGGYVIDGENALVTDSVSEIAAAIDRLVGDPDLRERIGQRGRDTAGRYSWTAVAAQYAELLEELERTQ